MSEFSELEYKYRADNIKLSDFRNLMNQVGFYKSLDVSSWDVYYVSQTNKESFLRLRLSDDPELTKKIKVKNGNNWERVEVDLPLDYTRLKESTVDKYAEVEGYERARKIYKSCFIFWQDNANYVYYIVYDEDLKELGRFIEVEVNKNMVNELNNQCENGAMTELNKAQSILASIGITAQNRMKKSLFELYVKE
jgi:adenylate cyclase class IV